MSPALLERFCETPPQGYLPAAQAKRELGVSRQTLWGRIPAGALQAKRITRGPDKGLYVRWDDGARGGCFSSPGRRGSDS